MEKMALPTQILALLDASIKKSNILASAIPRAVEQPPLRVTVTVKLPPLPRLTPCHQPHRLLSVPHQALHQHFYQLQIQLNHFVGRNHYPNSDVQIISNWTVQIPIAPPMTCVKMHARIAMIARLLNFGIILFLEPSLSVQCVLPKITPTRVFHPPR